MKSGEFLVRPGGKFSIPKRDPAYTAEYRDKAEVEEALGRYVQRLDELQQVLYADNGHALLIVLQAMDAGGKDGAIRHVMSGVNPQGCGVTSFKAPSSEELEHDFLWRVHRAVPRRGEIGIFNRSHYEDVLVVRVHGLVPRAVWSKRYGQINAFEEILAANGVKILKFFLHISKEEQKRRFEARIDDPRKNWKVSPSDFAERKYWDDYMRAYEEALARTSTDVAPWYVIPADRKWFRNLAVSRIIVEAMEGLNLKYPKPAFDLSKVHVGD